MTWLTHTPVEMMYPGPSQLWNLSHLPSCRRDSVSERRADPTQPLPFPAGGLGTWGSQALSRAYINCDLPSPASPHTRLFPNAPFVPVSSTDFEFRGNQVATALLKTRTVGDEEDIFLERERCFQGHCIVNVTVISGTERNSP